MTIDRSKKRRRPRPAGTARIATTGLAASTTLGIVGALGFSAGATAVAPTPPTLQPTTLSTTSTLAAIDPATEKETIARRAEPVQIVIVRHHRSSPSASATTSPAPTGAMPPAPVRPALAPTPAPVAARPAPQPVITQPPSTTPITAPPAPHATTQGTG